MMRRFVCVVLLAASVLASPAHAVMSAVNPTLLQNLDTRREYPPEASCFLGEAYRLRDEARAEREFRRGDTGETNTRLRQYLALDPAAADRTFVEYYISLMDSPAPADNNLPKAE